MCTEYVLFCIAHMLFVFNILNHLICCILKINAFNSTVIFELFVFVFFKLSTYTLTYVRTNTCTYMRTYTHTYVRAQANPLIDQPKQREKKAR
jgi:hypothetical protein